MAHARWTVGVALALILSAPAACSSSTDDAPCEGSDCAPGTSGEGGASGPKQSCSDGVKNDDETDVDCGGSCAKCATSAGCMVSADCASLVCNGALCAAPTCTDGLKNGTESDADCGGTCAPCAVSAGCNAHADCQSDACDYTKHCVLARSCTAHHGGDTCGPGPDGDPQAKLESCCIALPVTKADTSMVMLDKYVVTAGRMRAFVERYNGDLQGYIATVNPPATAWQPEWKQNLPTNMTEALAKLGPYPTADGFTREGCNVAGGGARTYWQPPIDPVNTPTEMQLYGKDVLDEKALQCVEIFMLAAFCIWDGAHLAGSDDLIAAWGPAAYPWGSTPAPTQNNTDTTTPIYNYVVHEFGKEFQGPYTYLWPTDNLDQTAHIAAPGRRPLGAGPFGHMDLAGLVFEISSGFATAPNGSTVPIWLNSGSWEAHDIPANMGMQLSLISNEAYTRAYWAAGGRCAR